MHVIFIPYGDMYCIERLIRDMQAQKHKLVFYKDKVPVKDVWITGSVRFLPFGVYEYVFPKENLDLVLTTLGFQHENKDRYEIGSARMFILRKILKCVKAPEFDSTNKYLWIRDNVSIIPIGVRYDGELTETETESKGLTHEEI